MKMTSPLYSLRAWKGISSDAISKLYGLEGSGVFRRESSYTQLEKWYRPTNPRTSLQQVNRAMFAAAVSGWQALALAERQAWKHFQDQHRQRPVMDGFNLYISRFMLSGGDPGPAPDD
jgi:hypothetical protein